MTKRFRAHKNTSHLEVYARVKNCCLYCLVLAYFCFISWFLLVMCFCALEIFSSKKQQKQAWNCLDSLNLQYYYEWQSLSIFAKHSILDIWEGSEYTSESNIQRPCQSWKDSLNLKVNKWFLLANKKGSPLQLSYFCSFGTSAFCFLFFALFVRKLWCSCSMKLPSCGKILVESQRK